MDISKRDASASVPNPYRKDSFTTTTTIWGATTDAILDVREHLLAVEVTLV